MIRSCISVVSRKTWICRSLRLSRVQMSTVISLDEIKLAETELWQNRMYLDHYRTASKNIRGIDCNCGWSFFWCTQSGCIFWQPIKFETAYLQCYKKLLFSAAATVCHSPFTAVRRPENSVPGIHHVPAGLLQLVDSGTTGLWCQSSTIFPECSRPYLWWCNQIWFCWECVARWIYWECVAR